MTIECWRRSRKLDRQRPPPPTRRMADVQQSIACAAVAVHKTHGLVPFVGGGLLYRQGRGGGGGTVASRQASAIKISRNGMTSRAPVLNN